MTNSQFNQAEVKWANGILAAPTYVMPNGKNSHDVAKDVISKAMNKMLDQNKLNAFGQWR